MSTPTVLVSTWSDGVFALAGETRDRELAGELARSLVHDLRGGALAIVGAHDLRRRAVDGAWSTVVSASSHLACCVAVGDAIYLGTEDARVLCLRGNGVLEPLPGFDSVEGREKWYAGQAVVEGRVVGPPLGVRSISANADGSALLANVHVGGIPRSTDGGATWHPTIEVDSDVHEVRGHPRRPELVIAAAAVGLCASRDGGASWEVEREGLHASHCLAVAFSGNDVLVSASEDPFSAKGAVYRRPIDEPGPLVAVRGGLPEWLDGAPDTNCISSNGPVVAFADKGGSVYVSTDAGHHWSRLASGLPSPSSVLVVSAA